MKLAFLGAGKMATAIACGLVRKEIFTPGDILASDAYEAARTAFTERSGATCLDDNAAVLAQADAVVLAVKPQDAPAALAPLAGHWDGKLLISIAAGLNLAKLGAMTGSTRIIRVMPNTPAMVGLGASVYACGHGVTDADRVLAGRIFGAIGIAYEQSEAQLDAVTGVSGSGPAYVFEFVEAMVQGAEAVGLERQLALALVVQTVAGAAEMLQRDLGTPEELRNAVTSKGGTTAAGLAVFAEADFRDLVARVIARATARSVELGKA